MLAGRQMPGCLMVALAFMVPASAGSQATTTSDSLAALALVREALADYFASAKATLPASGGSGVSLVAQGSRVDALRSHALMLGVRLDSAAVLSPRDERITAIRVYRSVTLGKYTEAERTVLDSCREPEWWCTALRGFVYHSRAQFADAEADFRAALQTMSKERRCLWDDLSKIMNDLDFANYYGAISCEERAGLTEQIWWLSQPLWMEQGNERRTEHYSRWVTAEVLRIQSELQGASGVSSHSAGVDVSAILRVNDLEWYEAPGVLGVDSGCEQGTVPAGPECRAQVGVSSRADRFLPDMQRGRAPFAVGLLNYALGPGLASGVMVADTPVPPRSRGYRHDNAKFGELYGSRYGPVYVLRHAQAAVFPRSGGGRLFVSFDPGDFFGHPERAHGIRPGTARAQRTEPYRRLHFADNALLRVGVAVSAGPDRSTQFVTADRHSVAPVRLEATAAFDSAIVSVEARDPHWRVAARHRFAVHNPSSGTSRRVSISDIMLYDASEGHLPPSVDAAVARMLPRSAVTSDEDVGLFWELRGLRAGEAPQFEISVAGEGADGLVRSVVRSLGFGRRAGTLLTSWRDALVTAGRIGADGETAYALLLDLRSFKRGDYSLTLTVSVDGQEPMITSRWLQVR